MLSQNKNEIAQYLLPALMLLALLNSGYFFLGILRLSLVQWLAFNACSLAILVYLVCFVAFQLLRKEYLKAIPLLPLYYYGTMGLFLMPWTTANIFAHATHIIITIALGRQLILLVKKRLTEALGTGLLIGMLVFVPVFASIQSYTSVHMSEFLQILQKF